MATAEELLSGVSTVDKTLIISNDLRTINIPSSVRNLGVESDDDVLQLNFRMPRYIGTIDLSTFSIRINYINSQGDGNIYTVDNPISDEQFITFTWLVGPSATMYKGNTKFNVCLRKLNNGNEIDKEYNTTIATLPVLEGLEVDESFIESYVDLLTQWQNALFGISPSEITKITAASADEQLAIKSAGDDERQAIVNKGAEVLATIPTDYTETSRAAQESIRTKADAIICEAQGEVITVSDSSDDRIRGLRVFGKTAQVTTTGKQLIDINQSTIDNRGITFTPNTDGSIHVSGTATADAYYVFDSKNPVPNKETELIATITGSDKVYMVVGYYKADGSTVNSIADVDDKSACTFKYPEEAYTTRTFIGVNAGVSVNTTVYPMIRLASITDDSYEPYSGGIASPSPQWPQEITSVESPTAYIYSKNLLGADATRTATLVNGVTFNTVEGSSEYVFNGTATDQNGSGLLVQRITIPPGTYTCSVRGLSAGTSSADYINMKVYNSSKYLFTGLGTKTTRSFTIEESTDVIVEVVVCAGSVYNNTVVTVQLEIGTSATEHEKCAGQQMLAVSTVNHLPAVPVSSGGNYTDANGQQWLCDEIDFERGKYIQRVVSRTFDGTESWYKVSNKQSFYLKADDVFGNSTQQSAICTHAINNYGKAINNVEIGYFALAASNSRIYFTSPATSATDFENWLAVQNAAGMPVTIYSKRNEPVELDLTVEELAAYSLLRTNCPNTTVLNDSGVHMVLKYNADTKTYIDNRIDAAVNAWLSSNYGGQANGGE